ncbi:MAG TPA: hypothetical protein VFE45_06570, partial [Coriobacteriia bacterium]|nr:hypothetical protein [Coriobacteriia bacterium]
SRANFFVISRRAAIDNPSAIQPGHQPRGHSYVRHALTLPDLLAESSRRIDDREVDLLDFVLGTTLIAAGSSVA